MDESATAVMIMRRGEKRRYPPHYKTLSRYPSVYRSPARFCSARGPSRRFGNKGAS